ncbi:hypothetical protein NDU88_000073 [Pleurodeles waltl]|uniref:Uncharacterized protein n=1 Tax=Pleurodeles waltl TaxID=8319 RepID=A0AAV7VSF3_PLEWA|nr:hypothetical protein NDU88_000073 [Pleurodeles waltl]
MGLEAGRRRVAEVGPTLTGHGGRGRCAWLGLLEVSPDSTGGRGAASPGAGWRCEHCAQSGARKSWRWCAAEVDLTLTGHGDRGRGARLGPQEVSPVGRRDQGGCGGELLAPVFWIVKWLRGAYDRRWPDKQVAGGTGRPAGGRTASSEGGLEVGEGERSVVT